MGTLEDIARHFCFDKSYLSRRFKINTGYTISEFTNIQKIQRSQKLLQDSHLSIADIAAKVGYDNITYYNRVFKKYTETSPLQYRKKTSAYKKALREKNNF
ncbi:helix-turn-helix domain-containing protein [Lapidilactobacillus bayanensis]|uniref:helix-turn-helix domain-containing protein n=1 Tax=Lapidilactobacillus bayanensis TaxID=2485998 RepID=UPI001CDB63FB|nr:helix-turn-helix transcriptional regulator [Lapidilactobacillus bayanensis]